VRHEIDDLGELVDEFGMLCGLQFQSRQSCNLLDLIFIE
jgi:hypothetical protein